MTQENNAANPQYVNDSRDAAAETFAQDWLSAEEIENVGGTNAASRSPIVATLPDWTTFSSLSVERRERRDWRQIFRNGALRTSGVALAAFGLGVFCASGWRGEEKEAVDAEIVANENDYRSENAPSFENGAGETSGGSLAAIDSSTLRSVPNARSDAFIPESNGAVAANWGSGDASTGNVDSAEVNGWAKENGAADSLAENLNGAAVANAANSNVNSEADSNWRRGVDFQRDLETSSNWAANVERFPTWDDLEANAPVGTVAPNGAVGTVATNGAVGTVAPNASIASAPTAVQGTGDARVANETGASETVETAQYSNALVSTNVAANADYNAYNDGAGYQGGDAANLTAVAPQFAGNSQNSGYNQVNGSENFAGLTSATANYASNAPAPTANYASVAPAPTANYASNAPAPTANYASNAPAPTANFASNAPAPTANFASNAPAPTANFASNAPAPTANFASNAPTPTANFASNAPAPTANFASSAPAPTANFASSAPAPTANFASSAPAEAPRAMVAQVPTENAPAPTANVPASNPNLRW